MALILQQSEQVPHRLVDTDNSSFAEGSGRITRASRTEKGIITTPACPGGAGINPSKLMLTILAGVAIWERKIMLERQREDIAKPRRHDGHSGGWRDRSPWLG
jgi:hypothetical protein